MSWVTRERGPAWKHGWTENTLASLSLPPMQLLVLLAVVVLLLMLHTQQSVMIDFKLLLLALLILFIFVTNSIAVYGTVGLIDARVDDGSAREARKTPPWGVAVLIFLLLMLLWNRPYYRSQWSSPF